MKKRILIIIGSLLLIYLSYLAFYYFGAIFYVVLAILGLLFVFLTSDHYTNNNSRVNYQNNKVSLIEHKFLTENIFDYDTNKDGIIMVNELYPLSEEEVIKKILDNDKNFKKDTFDLYVRRVFKNLMKAYSTNNVNLIRPYESNSLFFQDKYMIDEYVTNNFSRKITDIYIKGSMIKDYKIEGANEILVVALSARLKDYVVSNVDQSLIIGDAKESVNNTYFMTFIRKKEKFKSIFDINNNECPNCGANLNLDEKGVCDYCHTSLVLGDYYWVLVDIKNIKL